MYSSSVHSDIIKAYSSSHDITPAPVKHALAKLSLQATELAALSAVSLMIAH
jgi:hypothetical protein